MFLIVYVDRLVSEVANIAKLHVFVSFRLNYQSINISFASKRSTSRNTISDHCVICIFMIVYNCHVSLHAVTFFTVFLQAKYSPTVFIEYHFLLYKCESHTKQDDELSKLIM